MGYERRRGELYVIELSIIIPVYNVELYLDQCIRSVINYKEDNIEIILIDDGSTDKSGKICDKWEAEDSRIKVIHKPNGGLSDARNTGMKLAKGKYYFFLDSDDYISGSSDLKKIVTHLIKAKPKLLIINSKKVYPGNYDSRSKFNLEEDRFEEYSVQEALSRGFYHACAWNKIICSEILKENRIQFPYGRLSEDIEYCGLLLDSMDNVTVYYKPVYSYRMRKGSISNSVSNKHLQDIYEMIHAGIIRQNSNEMKTFLSYEYAVLLGISGSADRVLAEKILKLRDLLNYGTRKKVRAVNFVRNIFGIRMTRRILIMFIELKKIRRLN